MARMMEERLTRNSSSSRCTPVSSSICMRRRRGMGLDWVVREEEGRTASSSSSSSTRRMAGCKGVVVRGRVGTTLDSGDFR